MRIGIGTDSPTNTLDVDGTVRVRQFGSSTSTTVCRDTDGVLSACSSNEHLKDNITDLNIGDLDTIRQLQARQFNWKDDGRADLGFIAEEVESINPLLAQYEADGTLSGVKYTQLTALLTQGMQQLDSQVQQDSLRLTQAEQVIGNLVVASSSYLQNNDSANFSSLNVSGNTTLKHLTVTGNATIQGSLTVNGTLKVARAEVTESLTVGGRILSQTSKAPEVKIGNEAHEGIISIFLEGTDTAGTITVSTIEEENDDDIEFEIAEQDEYVLGKISFIDGYELTSRISLTAMNADAANLRFYAERTDDGFVIKSTDKLQPGKSYVFDYLVIGADAILIDD